ncbi:Homeobox HD1 [Gossypium australe]|uniref:Homeobox HD1 n=1 Tax=Gossypium australe TaxID=47621 RepID=A0A5B6VQY8_9ROSI|nr:Homeobox HD1 [Gossypium australe]
MVYFFVFGSNPTEQRDAGYRLSVGMKNLQSTEDIKPSTEDSHEPKTEQNNQTANGSLADTGSLSASSNNGGKVSCQDIELVQNLIERCLQLYMNRDEVVKTLLNRARIDPGFTTLVWQKLEEENAEFFRAYYIRLKLKKHILLFNHLLEHQYHMMKYPVPPKVPLAPIQNGIHPMNERKEKETWAPKISRECAVNNLPMGYPVLQPPIPAAGQPHLDSMGISSCHVVNGVPAPSNFQPMQVYGSFYSNSSMLMDSNATDVTPAAPPTTTVSSMSEMPVSPTSVASSGNFPFTASDMSGIGVDTSALGSAFTTDVASSVGLQLGPENGAGNSRDSLRSLDQIQWNFSLTDLTADLSNLGDLGALGNYPGSPFLASDSEILLDSSEQEDIVEEFFVDSVPDQPNSPSEEEKP